ncbi:hypothetical protein A6F68_00987 [Tsuneonella dongtanensis]|uniref:DUF2339 domain-containing protein n=2 Tax=Tsuneonella dongtanensis TaxID=692370 RepID=A0A1B2ABG7_9SPHN|nr:hypothetical protein A6F68_00987 [Tsuneonella dongtanensis]
MEFVVIALIVATVVLWRRVSSLERRLAEQSVLPFDIAPAAPIAASARPASKVWEPEQSQVADPVAAVEAKPPESRLALPSFDFEDLFGRMLPIWAGGVTLAVAGFFLVRWSIDAGLLTPAVRVLLAGLFGVALVAGAEVAFRWRERVADPRVAQALAGAGLATLYAAFYLAGSTYGLIGSTFAFLGLAAVTAAAIGLSFRFGLPSAVLALVGGFAAPVLVGSEDANLPLLTLYLALVTAGLAFTGRRQDRAWLGVAALAGGLGWGALLLAGGAASETADAAILGAYLVMLGAILPALAGGGGRPHWLVRVGTAGLAAFQIAVLVEQGGFGGLEWGLYLLLGGALAWFGWREPAMREANAVAAAVGIVLLAVWPTPPAGEFALVATGLAAIFALVPLAQLWRGHGREIDVAQAAGVALGLAGVIHGRFALGLGDAVEPLLALALLAVAAIAALGASLARRAEGADHRWAWLAQGVAALVAYDAVAQLAPDAALAWIAALAVIVLAWRGRGLAGALATLAALAGAWALIPLNDWLEEGLYGLAGSAVMAIDLPTLRAMAQSLLPVVAAASAWRLLAGPTDTTRRVLEAVAVAGLLVSVHIAYRHVFAGIAGTDFAATGVIERAGWEGLLLAAACLTMARGLNRVALALALAALAHFGWFAVILHNPLWANQAVGPLPIANALVPMYGAGLAGLVLLRRRLPDDPPWLRWTADGATMALLALFALSQLRQAFAGSILTATAVGPTEDLLRSLAGIVLAIGFLLWGSRGGGRTWRIGSLAAMVIAVLKVFLVDAAGLEGLARVGSFMALGFSLIGIGWFYNRQLREPAREIAAP